MKHWAPPRDFPNLADASGLVVDLECNDEGLRADIGSGWPWRGGHVVGVSVATLDSERAWYFPMRHESGGNLDPAAVQRWGRDNFNVRRRWGYLFHGALYDHGWGTTEGWAFPGLSSDTGFAGALLDEFRFSYSLESLCEAEGLPGKDYTLLREGLASIGLPPDANPRDVLHRMHSRYVGPYAERDVLATRDLWRVYAPRLEAEGLARVFRLECDLIPMLTAMRARGIRVDVEGAYRLLERLRALEASAPDRILKEFGHRVGSPLTCHADKDLAARICDARGVKYPRTPKTGKPSFKKDWIEKQPDPFFKAIRAWKESTTIRSLCLEGGIIKHQRGGRIYPELHPLKRDSDKSEGKTAGTVSGRFSCGSPNAQQASGRTELGKEVRALYLPEEGEDWVRCDVSQQEPRLTVHYALLKGFRGAEEAAAAFRRALDPRAPCHCGSGKATKKCHGDWHQIVADQIGMSRDEAKPINLGIGYGMRGRRLAANLGIPMRDAERQLAQYHRRLPFVSELFEDCMRRANALGYVKTLLGRRCRFERWESTRSRGRRSERDVPLPLEQAVELWGDDIQRAATYIAMNRVIQGSSADQIKLGMKASWDAGHLPLLQLHDELDYSVPRGQGAQHLADMIRDVVELRVPVVVDIGRGANWRDAK